MFSNSTSHITICDLNEGQGGSYNFLVVYAIVIPPVFSHQIYLILVSFQHNLHQIYTEVNNCSPCSSRNVAPSEFDSLFSFPQMIQDAFSRQESNEFAGVKWLCEMIQDDHYDVIALYGPFLYILESIISRLAFKTRIAKEM